MSDINKTMEAQQLQRQNEQAWQAYYQAIGQQQGQQSGQSTYTNYSQGGQQGYTGYNPQRTQHGHQQYQQHQQHQTQQHQPNYQQQGYNRYQQYPPQQQGFATYQQYQQHRNFQQQGYRVKGQKPPQLPTSTLWVGNVGQDWVSDDIHGPFSKFGYIQSIKLFPQKSCAFVKFSNVSESTQAFKALNGHVIKGTAIKIGWGKPDPPSSGNPPCQNLYIGGIAPTVTEQDLAREFGVYGQVVSIKIMHNKRCAFVHYSHLQSALNARNELQGKSLNGSELKINFGKLTSSQTAGMGSQVVTRQEAIPNDPLIKSAIDVFAQEVIQRGKDFEEEVRTKNLGDPQFSFLSEGGKFNDYYRWKIYDLKSKQQSWKESENTNHGSTTSNQVNTNGGDVQEFGEPPQPEQESLDAAKTKILNEKLKPEDLSDVKKWIFEEWSCLVDILKVVNNFAEEVDEFPTYMRILNLMKELAEEKRGDEYEYWISCQVTDCAGPIFRGAFLASSSDEERTEIEDTLKKWRELEVLENSFIDELVSYKEGVYGPFTQDGEMITPENSKRSKKKRSRSESEDDDNEPPLKKKKLEDDEE